MPKVLIMDPAGGKRDGWHDVYGNAEDALAGNVSRVFLTGVPMSVPTSKCRQPDDWSCGPYSIAECLGYSNGEEARNWMLARGLITSEWGTEYSGVVGYLGAKGYSCSFDGKAYDGQMTGAIFEKIINHLKSGYKVILCMHGTRKGCRTNYYSYGGHFILLYDIEGGSTVKDKIAVDGKWGQKTTRKAQSVLKSGTVDGIVSNQINTNKQFWQNCETTSWEFVPASKFKTGSGLIRAIQRLVGAKVDGDAGGETCEKLQKYLGVKADRKFGPTSVKAFQTWLNKQ